MRSRAGFTLVELLVAVLLIDVGLLAIVASGALIVRQTNESRAHAAAVRMALDRLESGSAAFPCAATSGSRTSGSPRLAENWSVRLLPTGDREIVDSVRFPTTAGSRVVVLRTRATC
jgi:Tfp pilus assembly protein PilV